VIATHDVERARLDRARFNVYAFRHLRSMQRQLERAGRGDVIERIEAAWREGGSRAAAPVLDAAFGNGFDFVGVPEACAERLDEQAAAGVDLHPVLIDTADPREFALILRTLLG
jgi:alkanesulfonate monooxygenase SsuD/methylene tetrahydromethanopterin reductase-like flavin-dependent oxidoreductase (luciferase family)